MYALVCLSILGCAFAAPQHWGPPPPPPHHHNHHHHHHDDLSEFMGEGIFDTPRFMNQLNTEMARFDQMMQEFMKYFPKSESSAGIQGNQYKISIVLNEFAEKEITVKARDGLVMVQAVHKYEDGSERNYLDVRSLPTIVKADSGSWTFDQGVLRIMFPLKENSITTEAPENTESTEVETQEPESEKGVDRDREEMESNEHDNTDLDADVGITGESDGEIITNEIPDNKVVQPVETTTYAVDFNNDVEFVPVQMKQIPE